MTGIRNAGPLPFSQLVGAFPIAPDVNLRWNHSVDSASFLISADLPLDIVNENEAKEEGT